MRRTWPLAVLFVAPVLVLVSLYMPWREPSPVKIDNVFFTGSHPTVGLKNLFSSSYGAVDGWSSVGNVAALSALLLALLSAGAFVWPGVRDRLPALPVALALAYFVLAVAAQTRLQAHVLRRVAGATGGVPYRIGYGTYVGAAAAALALIGAVFAGPVRWSGRPTPRRLCAAALAVGLLVALLLPWRRTGLPASVRISELGIAEPPGAIAATATLGLLAGLLTRAGTRVPQLPGFALGALLFAGAAFTVSFGSAHASGAWVGIGFAAAAALVVLADRSLLRSIPRPSGYTAAGVIAAAAVVTSLFLPWETACYGKTAELETLGVAGRCVSANDLGLVGSTAACLAIGLIVAVTAILSSTSDSLRMLEFATALALFGATLGFGLETGTESGVRLGLGYGAIFGFVAMAMLVALALGRLRSRLSSRAPDFGAALPFLLPLVLAIAYLGAVVVPWWGVLPAETWSTFIPRFARISWLTVAGALTGVRLVWAWVRQARRGDRGPELVLLSCALVVLAVLDAVPLPTVRLNWNSGVLLGLSVPLMLLAWIEERGGLRNIQVPEILRIDRI